MQLQVFASQKKILKDFQNIFFPVNQTRSFVFIYMDTSLLMRNSLLNSNFGSSEFKVIHTKVLEAQLIFLLEKEGPGSTCVRRQQRHASGGGRPGKQSTRGQRRRDSNSFLLSHFCCAESVGGTLLSNSHSSFEHSKGKVLCLPLFCHFSLGYFKLILVLTDPDNRSFFRKQTHDIRILEKDDNGILKSLSQSELKLFYLPASEITNPVPYHSISVLKSLF